MRRIQNEYGYFWLKRLHDVSGVLLAGAFILLFLLPWSSAFGGSAAFDRTMMALHRLPLYDLVTTVVVGVLILFHIAVGVLILYESRANIIAYPFSGNAMYLIRRATGLLLIPFVLYQLYVTRLGSAASGATLTFRTLQQIFAPLWMKVIAVGGMICLALYCAAGLHAMLSRWGATASRRSREASAIVAAIIGIVLGGWGVAILLAF